MPDGGAIVRPMVRRATAPGVYDRAARAYHVARGLPLDALEGWRTAVAPYLAPRPCLPVVDVGSGTGVFARAFAEWFGVRVVGVEPSDAMREEAWHQSAHPDVSYTAGSAAQIPLPEGSCSCAWLSTVIHHIPSLDAAARELRRVLAADAPVFVRSAFPQHHDHITLFRFFPGAREVAQSFPTIAQLVDAFASAGFSLEHVEDVPQVSAPSLEDFCGRLPSLRAVDSTLVRLSDEEFRRGLEAVRLAAREGGSAPVVDRLTLVVLR